MTGMCCILVSYLRGPLINTKPTIALKMLLRRQEQVESRVEQCIEDHKCGLNLKLKIICSTENNALITAKLTRMDGKREKQKSL